MTDAADGRARLERGGERAGLWALALALAVGTVLRTWALGRYSLWIDEAATFQFASLPFRDFLRVLWDGQANMALYYALMRVWIRVGESEAALRSLSVIFGVATIPAVYLLGARLFDRATGAIASLLFAVHAFAVQWSREARSYSLLTLLLVLTAYFLVRALTSGRCGYAIALAVTAALAVYSHVFAILVLFALALAAALGARSRAASRSMLIAFLVFGHLCVPMAVFVLLRHGSQLAWIQPPTLASVLGFILVVTGGGGAVLSLLYIALGTVGAIAARERWQTSLLLLWLLAPPVLTLLASLAIPVFDNRYMVMCVPALTLLAARGLTRLQRSPRVSILFPAALTVAVALSGLGDYWYFQSMPFSDWRAAVRYVLDNQQPGDGLVFWKGNVFPFRYYSRGERTPTIVYPPAEWRPVTEELLSRSTRGYDRIWLVLHAEVRDTPEYRIVERAFAPPRFGLETRRAFPGQLPITVALYRSNG
jgi:uncharacterized membrane protein